MFLHFASDVSQDVSNIVSNKPPMDRTVSNCYPLRHLRQNRGTDRTTKHTPELYIYCYDNYISSCFIFLFYFTLLPLSLLLLICFIITLCM